MSKKKLTKQQTFFLKYLTCGILEKYQNIDKNLKQQKIPKPLRKKMNKAFNLIFEVNQSCFTKTR